MEDPGEELVGSFLREVLECDFVEFNRPLKFVQGEIDVVGINSSKKTAYFCEATTHLELGLQIVKDKRPNNVQKLVEKFARDIEYAKKFYPNFEHTFMFWSPIVKSGSNRSKYSQVRDVDEIKDTIKQNHGIDLVIVTNRQYLDCILKLRTVALERTDAIKSPIMRFLQIEEKLKEHLQKESKSEQSYHN